MKLPVFKAVGMTFAFVLQNWLDVLRILWLPVVIFTGVSFWALPGYMQTVMSLAQAGSQPSPEEMMTAMSAVLPLAFGLMLASIFFYLVVFTGLLKLVIRGEKPRLPFYIGFGGDEWRLLGTGALLVLILIGLEIVVAIVAGLGASLGMSVPVAGPIIAIVVACVALAVLIWVGLRLSLAAPAAVGARAIGIAPSWKTSKGNVWRLFGYWLIWALIVVAVDVGMLLIFMPGYFQAMANLFAAGGSPEGVNAASQEMLQSAMSMYDFSSPLAIARLAFALVVGVIGMAIWVVSGGVAWRLLTDGQSEK